jgi:membrane protease YdiL (CAAX protease family)
MRLLGYLSPLLLPGVPLLVFWLCRDRRLPFMYGLTWRGFRYKPYFLLLLLMVPVVVVAGLHPSFQAYYPSLKLKALERLDMGLPAWGAVVLYQFVYGSYFIWAEIVFRGFLVVGMEKYLGDHAVLPMLGPYAVRHFAKPPGETISSVLGGFLLGVFALRTKNILGGAIVHGGIAVLMDTVAWLFILYDG